MVNHSLTVAASHVVRLYLWDMMREHMGDIWKPIGTNKIVPIVAAQEQPELQSSENPYIVYAYDYGITDDLWQLQNETMALTVFTQSPGRLAATTKLCMRLFNRRDESARDINAWMRRNPDSERPSLEKYRTGKPQYDDWLDEFRNFKFLTMRSYATGVQPAPGEGRRVDGTIMVEMTYVERNSDDLYSNN